MLGLSCPQARNVLGTMLSQEPERRGSMDSVLGRAFFAGGASVTSAKMQVHTFRYDRPSALPLSTEKKKKLKPV